MTKYTRAAAVAATVVVAVVVASGAGRAQETRPLPDLDALSSVVRENLVRAERVGYVYGFKERRTDLHANLFGRIGTEGTSLFEVYPSATRRLTYRRLISRDGVPIDAQELAKQDREYLERAADVQRQLAAEDADGRPSREEDVEQARQAGGNRVEDIVGTLQFQVEGRTVYEGVPAIVVSFTPRPGAKPSTREGRMAQRFVGTAWIHEAAAEVMHVEATSIDSLSFGFGLLARLGTGTEATLTRQAVEPGLWMPTQITLKGTGRAALFLRRLVIDFAIDWFDYHRLEGDSATPFPDPGREPPIPDRRSRRPA